MEDVLCDGIFSKIGIENRCCFEAGAANGIFLSNTRMFYNQGWKTILVECDEDKYQKLVVNSKRAKCFNEVIQSSGLDGILQRADAPKDIDLLSLDIDGQEYYVWKNTKVYRPRIVVIEWSPYVKTDFIPKLDSYGNKGYNQAGLCSMLRLANEKDYVVVAVICTNLICVRSELVPSRKQWWDGEFPIAS